MSYRGVQVAECDRPAGKQWLLRRNCALSPGQLGWWFGTLGLLSLMLAGTFALQGAWPVVPFTMVELAALGTAYVAYARQAGDYERIVVASDRILVERCHRGRLATREIGAGWARVEHLRGRRGAVRLMVGRVEVSIGSFLPDESRERLARELRASLAERRA